MPKASAGRKLPTDYASQQISGRWRPSLVRDWSRCGPGVQIQGSERWSRSRSGAGPEVQKVPESAKIRVWQGFGQVWPKSAQKSGFSENPGFLGVRMGQKGSRIWDLPEVPKSPDFQVWPGLARGFRLLGCQNLSKTRFFEISRNPGF